MFEATGALPLWRDASATLSLDRPDAAPGSEFYEVNNGHLWLLDLI